MSTNAEGGGADKPENSSDTSGVEYRDGRFNITIGEGNSSKKPWDEGRNPWKKPETIITLRFPIERRKRGYYESIAL
jgi:hypothetical protein